MEKRTVGIVATVITVLFCGCPGLLALCIGAMTALVSLIPGATINNFNGSHDATTAVLTGLGTCCFGIIFIAIPIAVGFFTLRKKAAEGFVPVDDQPLPPAS
jgi:hypothetical protein